MSGKIRVNGEALTELVAASSATTACRRTDARSRPGIVLADLVGHESHGVSNNLAGFYLPDLESGDHQPRPNIRIMHETPVDRDAGRRIGAWASSSAHAS